MKKKIVFAQVLIVASIFSMFFLNNLNAQPTLIFNRVSVNWPHISLFFQVKCGSDLRQDLTTSNFIIVENGVEINSSTITCPMANRHCCLSVSLVVERSDKMGVGNPTVLDNAKNGIEAFVDAMDGNCDEAMLMSFSDKVRINVPMTNDKVLIKQSIDSLKAGGGQAVWDAVYASINELELQGTQECRGVIVFTSGNDVGSCHSFEDVIDRAIQYNTRIYTVGYGTGMNDTALSQLANVSGGKFYKVTNPSQLVSVYKEISTSVSGGFYECELVYDTKLSAYKERTISLTLQKLFGCPGTDTKVQKINIPIDTIPFPLDITLGSGKVYGRDSIKIPLTSESILSSTMKNVTFSVLFDTSLITFNRISNLYFSNRLITQKLSNGYRFLDTSDIYIGGIRTLAYLWFTAKDVKHDTVCTLILSDWLPQDSTYNIILHDGSITILARNPRTNCRYIQAPAELTWDQVNKNYSPNPFAVGFSINGCDDIIASSAQATISFDTTKLSLDNPKTYTQSCIPDFIDPNTTAFAAWKLYAKPSSHTDTVLITCTITFDKGSPVVCSTYVIIPKSPLVDVKEISSPSSFYLGQNYPNPFDKLTIVDCRLSIEQQESASFKIFDIFGREVLDLSGKIENGKLTIDNSQLPSAGIYFYRLTIGNQSQTRMMMLIR